MMQRNLKKIKEIVRELFGQMDFEAEVNVSAKDDLSFDIGLETEEPQILIGQGGETLAEVQHLLKIILRKKIFTADENFHINLDINDYKKKKIDCLKDLARETADEVALAQKEKELPFMPAFERRIIHLELAERTDVIAESTGQEPERKIVIKPRP